MLIKIHTLNNLSNIIAVKLAHIVSKMEWPNNLIPIN